MARTLPARLLSVSKWTAAVGVLAVAPLLVMAGFLVAQQQLDEVTLERTPIVAAAVAREIDDTRGAVVELAWTDGEPVLSPGWDGLVTAVHVVAGSELSTGDPVLTIDGVVRVVAHTDEPFFRPLSEGDEGRDVSQLHELLIELGYLEDAPPDSDRFRGATRRAIQDLARDLGDSSDIATFDPGWIVWVSVEPWTVGEVGVQIGQHAPGRGESIAMQPSQLESALVSGIEGGGLQLATEETWIADFGDGMEVPLGTSLDIATDHLAGIAELIEPGTDEVAIELQLSEPRLSIAVPTTAVLPTRGGALCVWSPSPGDGYRSTSVQAISSRAGITYLEHGPEMPEQVLANPADVVGDPSCD